MILTEKQQEGLRIAVSRFNDHEPWTCIAGYAGTGKSTLIKFIISALEGINPQKDVCYVAYTGKAANVLQQKGCPNATTAHQLLYKAKPMPNGSYKFIKKERLEYKVIVVDEISMLPRQMWEQLLTHKIYILATGDPGQLPPVDKDEDNHVLDTPHIFLDEIMRQAQDSEIIRLSMWIREGKPIGNFPVEGKQVQIFNKNQLVTGMFDWADQILCATNNKRNEINNLVRRLRGYPEDQPTKGDKIISLHNHWAHISDSGTQALTNGTIGTLSYYYNESLWLPRYIHKGPLEVMFAEMDLDDDSFSGLPVDYKCLLTGEPTLDGKQRYLLKQNKNVFIDPPYEFAYAYAITCHKAQGSEWDKILVFEERFPFDKEEHKRWLYTAVTRAKEKVVIVRDV